MSEELASLKINKCNIVEQQKSFLFLLVGAIHLRKMKQDISEMPSQIRNLRWAIVGIRLNKILTKHHTLRMNKKNKHFFLSHYARGWKYNNIYEI